MEADLRLKEDQIRELTYQLEGQHEVSDQLANQVKMFQSE
jgi:hypothetical protein